MKLRDQAYRAFIELLLARALLPGQFVTQRELVDMTGFPLGPVREMIPRLEADGLVLPIPQRGLQVTSVNLRMVREAFQLREIIETAALEHFVEAASDTTIATLRDPLWNVLKQANDAVTPELLSDAQALDWAFHDCIVAEMGNSLFSAVHRVNVVRIRVIMQDRAVLSPEILPPAMHEHAAIIRAIEQRDTEAAVAALHLHLASARARALGLDVIDAQSRQTRSQQTRSQQTRKIRNKA